MGVERGDSMGVHGLTDTEWEEYELAAAKADYICDHGKLFTEDCEDCDNQWALKDVIEGEIVNDDPDVCDHGIDLMGPGYGKCAECDKECSNNNKMKSEFCYRKVDGKSWRYDAINLMWKPISYNSYVSSGTGTSKWQGKQCKHYMQEFKLDDVHSIYASAERDAPYNDKRHKSDYPDLSVYLYSGWVSDYQDKFTSSPELDVPWQVSSKRTPEWPMTWLEWPDYSVPKNLDDVLACLEWTWEHIVQGERVETGCLGGHGRTGTFLACLLAMNGVTPGLAMGRVWNDYCEEAIESKSQMKLIVTVHEHYHGKKWRKSKTERESVDKLLAPKVVVKKVDTPDEKKCIHGRKISEPCTGCEYAGWAY